MFGKYGAFAVQPSLNGVDAIAVRELDGETITIELNRAAHVLYEGLYGVLPVSVSTALAGACLYGREWEVEFEHLIKSNPPCRKSPALESERLKILEKLKQGKRIVAMRVAQGLREYHYKLITWQGCIAHTLGVTHVYYHVPASEYHHFIAEIERESGSSFPGAHTLLDAFAQEVREYVLEAFDGILVTFIEPFPLADGDPYTSFLLPYRHPELFDIPVAGLVGVENMVEVTLAHKAKRSGGHAIPVFTSVISIPNPYFEKGDETNVIVLEPGE